MRATLAGGGTGGHVIPALAIARELQQRYQAEVLFIGTARGIENRLVPAAGFELRLDYLQDLADLEVRLHQTLIRLHFPPFIATCRRVVAGGHFAGSVEEQLAVLASAVRAGCQWVDIEVESLSQSGVFPFSQFAPARTFS